MVTYLKITLNNIKHHVLALVIAFLVAGCSNEVPAASVKQLHVITSGGFATAYKALAPKFEQQTGIKLITSYGSSSGGAPDSIPVRLADGQQFDVIILSKNSLDNLQSLGYVLPNSALDLVRSSIGMAVKEGARVPDISSNEAFINTLLNAKSIGYSASASGTYLSTDLWPKLGIWQAIRGKSKRILSERVATVVARGEVDIGFQQVSEILPIKGAKFAGKIPADFQKLTIFSTGIVKGSLSVQAAEHLIRFLSSKDAASTIQMQGLEPLVLELEHQ
ncbi:molybdate transport system substrate-binding protein [Colwellia chukchiensis]|uniref:Molybdate transport system substrate-binding protein n=1 Tax=Colwellia chukchiensis TaxID=641665 RepID=A0A1H7N699_9GAMM|nr:substrate-binding domain-containing protein [Colwellia chukchiensis]SEL19156.1 molybdate transport system substrate-binding protein [Colwellia chukchiensis]